jgi:dCTP deaminase
MLLSDRGLKWHIAAEALTITPFDESLIQPASIDVRLDKWFRVFNNHQYTHIDPSTEQADLTRLVEVKDGPFVLHPGEFVLGSTLETVSLDASLAARAEGKSSLGRLGLLVHSTAGFIDPGFSGQVTLELSNVANLPITLWPGMKIGQLCVFQLSSPAEAPYGSGAAGSRYQSQAGPTPSRAWENWQTWATGNLGMSQHDVTDPETIRRITTGDSQ